MNYDMTNINVGLLRTTRFEFMEAVRCNYLGWFCLGIIASEFEEWT